MKDAKALAREAIIYALPVYEMARMRASSSPRKNADGIFADANGGPESLSRWVNLFSHSRQLLNAKDRRVVTPNNDTLYTNAWLDLSDGPLFINTPDTGNRYYVLGLIDQYTNPFSHLGTRTNGNSAHTFFLHGPDWKGKVPEDCLGVSCPTNSVWVLGRILASEDEDLTKVHSLQNLFSITTLDKQPAQRVLECSVKPHELPSDATTFLRVVNREMALNPPPTRDQKDLKEWAELGMGPDLPVPANLEFIQQVLTETLKEIDTPVQADMQGGWKAAVEVQDNFNGDWLTRARVARAYIGILGSQEVLYLLAFRDSDGNVLDGRKNYQIHFPLGGLPQVDAFWSLTLYRKEDYLFYDNPQQIFAIGDRTKGLTYDSNGGLTLCISHLPPTHIANWLPSPQEGFYLALRLYLPRSIHQEHAYVYPAIQVVN